MATIKLSKNINHHFFIIDGTFLNDNKLSYAAKGVLTYVISRPDTWTFNCHDISMNSTNSIESIKSAVTELFVTGYLIKF